MMLKEGLTHTSRLTVTEAQTAQVIGSGDLPVLATPAMLALMENAAMLAVANELEEGQTTVALPVITAAVQACPVATIMQKM